MPTVDRHWNVVVIDGLKYQLREAIELREQLNIVLSDYDEMHLKGRNKKKQWPGSVKPRNLHALTVILGVAITKLFKRTSTDVRSVRTTQCSRH